MKVLLCIPVTKNSVNTVSAEAAHADFVTHFKSHDSKKFNTSVNQLIELKIFDQKDEYGKTPLFYAIAFRSTTAVKSLLDAKADTSHKDKSGRTPLMKATAYGFTEIIEELLKHSPKDLDASLMQCLLRPDAKKDTLTLEDIELCKIFIAAGARGPRAMVSAYEHILKTKNLDLIKTYTTALIDDKKISAPLDQRENTPLQLALQYDDAKLVSELVTKGATFRENIPLHLEEYDRLLTYGIKKAEAQLINFLVESGSLHEEILLWAIENNPSLIKKIIENLKTREDIILRVEGNKLYQAAVKENIQTDILTLPLHKIIFLRSKDKDKKTFFVLPSGNTVTIQRYRVPRRSSPRRRLLGRGGEGKVWDGEYQLTDGTIINVACKKIIVSKLVQTNEHKIHQTLEHPHIIKFFEAFVYQSKKSKTKIMTVTERANGNMIIIINYFQKNAKSCLGLLKQMASALSYLHNVKKIIHRDIKPENILYVEDEVTLVHTFKLTDFGLAVEKTKAPCIIPSGTPRYVAPEVVTALPERPYDEKVDIFSLGVTLFVLFYARLPDYVSCDRDKLYPLGEPPENTLDHLIWWMTARNPKSRPSAIELGEKILEIQS